MELLGTNFPHSITPHKLFTSFHKLSQAPSHFIVSCFKQVGRCIWKAFCSKLIGAMSTPDTQRKRKRLASASGADGPKLVKRNCDLDLDILECPTCSEPFSLPVFQCPNGHPACLGCCKKLRWTCPYCQLPIGPIRCFAIEKIVESLSVSCKYAPHGCREMLKLTNREEHEKECGFVPNLHCPIPGCTRRGTKFTLPLHLKQDHSVRTVELNVISRTVGIRMKPSERLVMVKGIRKEMFLVHRDNKAEFQGEMFFCTSFGPNNSNYELKVSLSCTDRLSYSMANRIEDIRNVEDLEKEQYFHIFPSGRLGVPIGCGFDIVLGVFPVAPKAEEDRD